MKRAVELLDGLRELSDSNWAFAAVSAAVETGLLPMLAVPQDLECAATGSNLPAGIAQRILDVLTALGWVVRRRGYWTAAKPLLPLLNPAALSMWRADLRTNALQARRFLLDAEEGRLATTSWTSAGTELMQWQGLVSAASTDLLIRATYGQVPGLLGSLSKANARFLDAGAGVCGASIVIARRFPHLQIIAIEPNRTALRLARHNIEAAGLGARIELRGSPAETLRLRNLCDAAYISQEYFTDRSLCRALRNLLALVRPGGFLLTTASKAKAGGLSSAIDLLRSQCGGIHRRELGELSKLLAEAGYGKTQVLDLDAELLFVVAPVKPVPPASSFLQGSRP
jgi:precorrin-6B methylase 2